MLKWGGGVERKTASYVLESYQESMSVVKTYIRRDEFFQEKS